MSWLILFQRLMVRPLLRDPVRSALTVFAVGLGVAVVVAIDLAGQASAGEFRSSIETLSGEADLEISSTGGLDESLLAELVRLPYPLRFSPRVEGFGSVASSGRTVPIFGLDLIGDETLRSGKWAGGFSPDGIGGDDAVWVGRSLASSPGQMLRLQINDTVRDYRVQAVLDAEGFEGVSAESLVIMDIGAAQRALSSVGRLTRIQVHLPAGQPTAHDGREWRAVLSEALPAGAEIYAVGSMTEENRKMLGAFRWNLRVLSWLSLIVGAFLIYNTIAVSVVRRRAEIGVLRALGATRNQVRWAFLAEAGFFGAVGTLVGLAVGRALAEGALGLMSATISALYVTADPGALSTTAPRLLTAAVAGVGVALLSAWQPAGEAARIAPTEAMARGRGDHGAGLRLNRDLRWAGVLVLAAGLASTAPAVRGVPLFGYLAALLLLAASALAVPAVIRGASAVGAPWVYRALGVEGFLGTRSVAAALERTSILVAALSTAVAMMVSVGIMVGSFRDTVALWLERRLEADIYVRAAGAPTADRFPTIAATVADELLELRGVEAVDRFRAYPIRYNGKPAVLGATDAVRLAERRGMRLLQGGDAQTVLSGMVGQDRVLISEPFARKHQVWSGDRITLPLGGREARFDVAGVFYDYSSERGLILVDRERLARYLPQDTVSSLAVYLRRGADAHEKRARIIEALEGRELYAVTTGQLRAEAMAVFDRTFAITYALEAVALVVAILGMAGALLALVIDRKREMSVLRFLGASKGQIRKLVLTESGLLGLLATGIGAALGATLSLVLIFVINKQSFGWTIQFHMPTAVLLTALATVFGASLLAGVYPARVAAGLNPIEAVHEE